MTVDEVMKALASVDGRLKVIVDGYEVTKIESDTFYDSETGEEYDTLDIFTEKVKPSIRINSRMKENKAKRAAPKEYKDILEMIREACNEAWNFEAPSAGTILESTTKIYIEQMRNAEDGRL